MVRIAVILFLLLPCGLQAQLTGSIEGAATDPSGAAILGAQVRVVETSTNAERRLMTDRLGRYVAADLPPGLYAVEISSPGLMSLRSEGLSLTAGRTLRIDMELQLGVTRDSVAVVAQTEHLDAAAGSWGGSITSQQLSELPLKTRDIFDLASQQPGASVPASYTTQITGGMGVHISVNGSRPTENSFRLDGIYINDTSGSAPASAAGTLLGLETIAELSVVSSPFSAEYGRTGGGVLTAVSKSGSNEFHGSLYEFLRNSAFDAKNFFDSATAPIPPLRRNQYGGLIDGPVIKNKLFFLGNYESIRIFSSATQSPATLTAAAREGQLPVNGKITTVQVSPLIEPYLALYPLPNGRDFGDGTAALIAAVPTATHEGYYAGKLDYVPTERLRFGGRYTHDAAEQDTGDAFRVWTYHNTSHYDLVQSTAQFLQSASVIHDFRVAFSQIMNEQIATVPPAIESSLAFIPGSVMGQISVVGLGDFGGTNARTPKIYLDTDAQASYGITRVGGNHKLSAGASFDRIFLNEVGDLDRGAYYTFSSLQQFLTAQPHAVSLMVPGSDSVRHWRFNQFSEFVQEEMRLTPRLSLSLGLRYETAGVPGERDGKVSTLPDPVHDTRVTLGGPLFINPSRLNFAPRASLAWDVTGTGKTVIRAGAGIFDELLGTRELDVAGVRMPPFFTRISLTNPPFPDPLLALGTTSPPLSVDGFDFRPNQPYTIQFQVALQRQLTRQLTGDLTYAGTRGVHLVGDIGNINTTQPQYLSNGQIFFPPNTPAVNPAFDQIGMRLTNFDSIYHSLTASVRMLPTKGLTLQAKFTWSKSIDDDSSPIFADYYTRDKMPSVFNYRMDRGLSDFDCPFLFAANFSYDLPRTGHRKADTLLGGWQLHGLIQAQSGNPFNPTVGFDDARLRSSTTDGTQRPNLVLTGKPIVLGDPQEYFDPNAFSLPAPGYYGNLGRNVFLGPSLVFMSSALERTLWRLESRSLRLRAECFNIANHPNFQVPSGLTLFSSTGAQVGSAGRITDTTTSSRQIQLSARFSF